MITGFSVYDGNPRVVDDQLLDCGERWLKMIQKSGGSIAAIEKVLAKCMTVPV